MKAERKTQEKSPEVPVLYTLQLLHVVHVFGVGIALKLCHLNHWRLFDPCTSAKQFRFLPLVNPFYTRRVMVIAELFSLASVAVLDAHRSRDRLQIPPNKIWPNRGARGGSGACSS